MLNANLNKNTIKLINSPIIVIGMHRSGTTLLSKILSSSGVFMGSKYYIGNKNFESKFFHDINDWILFQRSSRWDVPELTEFKNPHQTKCIVNAVNKNLSSVRTYRYWGEKNWFIPKKINQKINFKFGWKDPKTSLNLDIWNQIFPNAKVLHIYRNPVDVVNSLVERETIVEKMRKDENKTLFFDELFLKKKYLYTQSNRMFDKKECFKLWKFYVSKCLNSNKFFKNILHLSYEKMLSNPEETFKIIENFCEIKIPEGELLKINSNRKFAFIKNKVSFDFYNSIKSDEIVRKLNYHNIV